MSPDHTAQSSLIYVHMTFPTMWYVRPAKTQTSRAYAQSDQSLCESFEYFMSVKLLTEHHIEFLGLNGGSTYSSQSTPVKMPHCWNSYRSPKCLNRQISEQTTIAVNGGTMT